MRHCLVAFTISAWQSVFRGAAKEWHTRVRLCLPRAFIISTISPHDRLVFLRRFRYSSGPMTLIRVDEQRAASRSTAMHGRCGAIHQNGRTSLWLGILGSLLLSATAAQATDVEGRDYAIRIDNKPAGTYHLHLVKADDGTTTVRASANVSYRVLLYRYTYTFRGTEVWKAGRLTGLTSTSNDDGKRFNVQAQADGGNLRVTVNGTTTSVRGDVWTTTAWRMPAARYRGHYLPMIDSDTGRLLGGRLEYVDRREITVGDNAVTCSHYRVTGGTQMELYFDGKDRLVRQETVEQGHATVLQLTGIQR